MGGKSVSGVSDIETVETLTGTLPFKQVISTRCGIPDNVITTFHVVDMKCS